MRLPGLSGSGETRGWICAAPQVEPREARFEPRDHDVGIVGQRHEADALRRIDPRMLAGLRMVAPDCRVLDVDPEERVGAVIPDAVPRPERSALATATRGVSMDGRMRHFVSRLLIVG